MLVSDFSDQFPVVTFGIGEAERWIAEDIAEIVAETTAKYAVDGVRRPCELLVVDRQGYSASGISGDDADLVVLNADAVRIALGFGRVLASNSQLLGELVPPPPHQQQYKYVGTVREFHLHAMRWQFPALIDPERERLAKKLATGVVLYTVSRELGHIRNGHIDYVKEAIQRTEEADVVVGDIRDFDEQAFWTLEWDADRYATAQLLKACNLSPYARSLDGDGKALFDMEDFKTNLEVFALIVTIAHVLTSQPIAPPVNNRQRDHLPFILRSLFCRALAADGLRRRDDEIGPVIGQTFLSASNTLYDVINIRSRALSTEEEELIIKTISEKMDLFENHWAQIRPSLDRLKRAGPLTLSSFQPWVDRRPTRNATGKKSDHKLQARP